MNTVLKGKVLRWARTRAGLDEDQLAKKMFGKNADSEKVTEWERTGEITFHQAELLAQKTYTPFGFLFLDEPPREALPIKDLRTVSRHSYGKPSPNMLDTIYECQRRQAWFREYLIDEEAEPLPFVGKASTNTPVLTTAADIRNTVKIGPVLSTTMSSWTENLSHHFAAVEEAGILLMRNGVVGNNNKRALSVDEFRGFALSDEYAPLIFINTRDAKAAQLFTLAHELVHVWIGESAISNLERTYSDDVVVEQYCNQVAAEVLVPSDEITSRWNRSGNPLSQIRAFAREYKVSTLVMCRRALDLTLMSRDEFKSAFDAERSHYVRSERRDPTAGASGDFHNTLRARASGTFCNALLSNTLSGKTPYIEAFRLLGIRNTESLHSFAKSKFPYLLK
jgi:Zn-dependent peptidase ImmA (M78 family)